MAYKNIGNLSVENAHIIFRNFSGKESKYNRAGNRNFCVIIENPAQAQALAEDGWNIRALAPRDPDEAPRYYLQVAVSYQNIPPKIYMVTKKAKTLLSEDMVSELDYADIRSVDLIISPYQWEISEKRGVKGYLKTMYVVIEEDEFAAKYAEDEHPEEDDSWLPF